MLARKPWRLKSSRLRARADGLRRARDFAGAVPLYRQYLAWRPDHSAAWMLFGHCLKECGQVREADEAYARAVQTDPRNRDALEARAHFLKSNGRRVEAQAAFAAAVALGAGAETQREAGQGSDPGQRPAADATPGVARIWIDISDLLLFLESSRNLSGIQRVHLALLDYVTSHPDEVCCVINRPWDARIWCLSRAAILDLHALFLREGGAGGAMRAALRLLEETARETPPVAGATLFLAGAFWTGGGNPPLLRALRAGGMRLVPLVYDLIPLRQPQFCVPAMVEEFTTVLGETLREADGILAISVHSAASVEQLMASHGMPAVPVFPVLLAHQLHETAAHDAAWSRQIAHLRDRPFVLSVGTVEPRKNHLLLLAVWQALAEQGFDPPALVIVGKRGWDADAFETEMRLTRRLGGRAEVFHDIADRELNALYGACLFTAFPSLAEGWGLPVGESLSRGKVCVASDRDSIPEVGGGAAIYIDPEDVDAAVPVFRSLLFEPGALGAAEARLRASFRPRGWPQVVDDMISALRSLRPAAEPADRPGPLLQAGVTWRPVPHQRSPRAQPLDAPLRMMLADGWQRPSPDGAAMQGIDARLALTVQGPGTIRLRLYADEAMTVEAGGVRLTLAASTAGLLEVPTGGGAIRLELNVEGSSGSPPPGMWLTGVSFLPVDPAPG